VAQVAPQLLDEPGLGPLIAAKLLGEIAGIERFATDAKLARAAGVVPLRGRSDSAVASPAECRLSSRSGSAVERLPTVATA
jgi:transposase